MECRCEDHSQDADPGWWLSSSNVQMGAFTLVGYLLYRFSQTLPALIRWPIRIFCSLTGLSALWGWVSRLVGTIRGIQTMFKWLSRIWRFFVGLSRSTRLTAVIQAITGSSSEGAPESSRGVTEEGLRMILLGPAGGGRTSLADMLLDVGASTERAGPLTESTRRRKVIDGVEVTAIDTPDLLGRSLGNAERAREALRSLQLASPGPHVFLLVIRALGSSGGADRDLAQEIQAVVQLFGEGAEEHIVPVFTHTGGGQPAASKAAASLCGPLRPEPVDVGPDRPPEQQSAVRARLLRRVAETRALRGRFVHSLQRREDQMKEELLADMSSALAGKLTHK